MTDFEYIPSDEELVFTFEDVKIALNKLALDDQDEARELLDMADELATKLPNVSMQSTLIILAEIGVQPNKMRRLRQLARRDQNES